MPAPAAAAGLKVIAAFIRLNEIQQSLCEQPSFADDLIRHARWAGNCRTVAERFARWRAAMAEWAHESDEDSALDAQAMLVHAFDEIAATQYRLQLTEQPAYPKRDVTADDTSTDIARPEELVAEGRMVAAIQTLRRAALQFGESAGFESWYEDQVNLATRLVELGDVDTAAALVAPILSKVMATWTSQTVMNALNVVKAARRPDQAAVSRGAGKTKVARARTNANAARPWDETPEGQRVEDDHAEHLQLELER